MRVTRQLSKHLDEAQIVDPDRRGQVAWNQFNQHYHSLQTTPWSEVNHDDQSGWPRRLVRLLMAWVIQRADSMVDLRGKARWFWKMPIPRDPNIVFFGAEIGWEAALVQALYGDGGRVVLIDNDPRAYERFVSAPVERRIVAPSGFEARELVIKRRPDKVEYVREDLFEWCEDNAFDVGIDWGLIEHFTQPRKIELMRRMQRFLKPGGVQISAVPRDTWMTRLFYWAFSDELNFGYRELMSRRELVDLLKLGGYLPEQVMASPSTCVACSRVGGTTGGE